MEPAGRTTQFSSTQVQTALLEELKHGEHAVILNSQFFRGATSSVISWNITTNASNSDNMLTANNGATHFWAVASDFVGNLANSSVLNISIGSIHVLFCATYFFSVTTIPTLAFVAIVSSNPQTYVGTCNYQAEYATTGDHVYFQVTSTALLQSLPSLLVQGRSANVTALTSTTFNVSQVVLANDIQGNVFANYSIIDLAGNVGRGFQSSMQASDENGNLNVIVGTHQSCAFSNIVFQQHLP